MSEPTDTTKEKKKKKAAIVYDIDPSLPEEEQRRLRKQIRADRRAERDERRKRRDAEGDSGGSTPTSPTTKKNPVVEEDVSSKRGSVGQDFLQKKREEDARKEKDRERAREAELSALKEKRAAEAASALSAAREKEKRQLEEAAREEDIRRHRQEVKEREDEEATRERRRQERAAREKKMRDDEERRREEEERQRREQIDAAKEERAREERKKREAEEKKRREVEEEEMRKRQEELRKKREEDDRKREREERARAAERQAKREEYERKRREEMKELYELQEERTRAALLQMSDHEREEFARKEEERWKQHERRERAKQVWAEHLRDAEEKVRRRYEQLFDRLRQEEDIIFAQKAGYAGAETQEWLHNGVPARSFYALGGLFSTADHLQLKLSEPEWVIVGQEGKAKSNLLDALLGLVIFKGIALKRTFRIRLQFGPEVETYPVAYIQGSKTKTELFKVPSEISENNLEDEEEPFEITLRYKFFWNVTFIVTPDVQSNSPGTPIDPDMCPVIMSAVAPVHRMVLWVGSCFEEEQPYGIQYARMIAKVDPSHSRSVLVLNRLVDALADLTLPSEANQLFSKAAFEPVYFVSFSSEKNSASDVLSACDADVGTLKRLKAFGAFDSLVGIKKLAKHVQTLTHQIYQRSLAPKVLSRINQEKSMLSRRLTKVDAQLQTIQPQQLRSFSSHQLTFYLQAFRAAMEGLAGDPSFNGETLQEERESTGTAHGWLVLPQFRISIQVRDSDVPQGRMRLLGKAAFNRLLADFSAAVSQVPLHKIDLSNPANSGPGRSGIGADFAFSATDVATKRIRDMLRPIMQAAVNRAAHIAKLLPDAAEFAASKKARLVTEDASSQTVFVHDAPFFNALLRDFVQDFVDAQAKKCQEAIDDEFRALSFLPFPTAWFAKSTSFPTAEEQELSRIEDMSRLVMEETRQKLLDTARMKIWDYMVDPLMDRLQVVVQARVSAIPFEELEATMEPEALRAKLLEEKCRIDQEKLVSAEHMRMFQTNVSDFAF